MRPGGHGGASWGIPSPPEGQGHVLRLVGESEYPGLCWVSSYTRFQVEVEFEVLIQVEL